MEQRDNYFTIPNLLTVLRLIIAAYIFYVVVLWQQHDLRTGQLTISALATVAFVTDFLDGWIARQWESQRSRWGARWDPIADKLSVLAFVAFVYAAGSFEGYWYLCVVMVILIIFREVAVSVLRSWVGHDRVPVVRGGKVKTAFQMAALLQFGYLPLLPSWWLEAALITLLVATVLTLSSGWAYFRPFLWPAQRS